MAILLTILKVIGIILLVILGIVLLLICLVLFVPVRYRIRGRFDDEEKRGTATVSWLLHAISVTAGYGAGEGVIKDLRVFGIPVLKLKEKLSGRKNKQYKKDTGDPPEKDPAEEHDAAAAEEETPAEESGPASPPEEAPEGEGSAGGEAAAEEQPGSGTGLPEEEPEADEAVPEGPPPPRVPPAERANALIRKIWEAAFSVFIQVITSIWQIPGKIVEVLTGVFDKITGILGTVSLWRNFLEDEHTAALLDLVLADLGKILGSLLPRKMKGEIHFGLGDPFRTGEALAALSALYPIYGGRLVIDPDFEEKRFSGYLDGRGRLFLFRIVWIAAALWFNKNTKFVLKRYKKLKEDS